MLKLQASSYDLAVRAASGIRDVFHAETLLTILCDRDRIRPDLIDEVLCFPVGIG